MLDILSFSNKTFISMNSDKFWLPYRGWRSEDNVEVIASTFWFKPPSVYDFQLSVFLRHLRPILEVGHVFREDLVQSLVENSLGRERASRAWNTLYKDHDIAKAQGDEGSDFIPSPEVWKGVELGVLGSLGAGDDVVQESWDQYFIYWANKLISLNDLCKTSKAVEVLRSCAYV